MNKELQDAILGAFQLRAPARLAETLAQFSAATWKDGYRWLDASGLALYFLDRVKCLRLQASLPEPVLQRLEQNLADNRERTADTFAELVRINQAFAAAGVTFANVKGISLVPHACPDPALRLQLDLDFLIEMRQVQACAVALGGLGYTLTAVSGSVWEFHSGSSTLPSVEDLYKPKPQRTVEVHFDTDGREALAARVESVVWDHSSFPVLGDVERFLTQVKHVLKHVRGEWTRLSWLLEFRHCVLYREGDLDFWREVRERAAADKDVATAIGVAVVLTATAFGDFAPERLQEWTVDGLEPSMRMWLDCYGRQAIMAEFPGTKLYLLQPQASVEDGGGHLQVTRKRLIPLHRAPKVVHGTDAGGFAHRLRAAAAQGSFILFRLKFHVVEGWRYLHEAPRWKRVLVQAQQKPARLFAASDRGLL